MSNFVSIGKILNFHGIKGEAKVGCSQLDFVMTLDKVFIKEQDKFVPYDILSARPNKKFVIIKFEGINDINEIIKLKGSLLFVEDSKIRENLKEDEFLIDELVGLEVFDIETEKKLGFVVGVSNNGATDLISIKTNSKKISLIPFVKAIVPVVDIKNKKIMINNLEGLIE